MKRYKLLLFIGIIFAFTFTITGCGNTSEEDFIKAFTNNFWLIVCKRPMTGRVATLQQFPS